MENTESYYSKLIAPCGVNCSLCSAYLRDKRNCGGCNADTELKMKHCNSCSISHCEKLTDSDSNFCVECSSFPCLRIKNLDKKYIKNYNHSIIENLLIIKNNGVETFLKFEAKKWECISCGGVVCTHTGKCTSCNLSYFN
jgi:hypothetical protein